MCVFVVVVVYSAPADAQTEDAAAHATGNGVASEVGPLHALVHRLGLKYGVIFAGFVSFYVFTSWLSDLISLMVLFLPS